MAASPHSDPANQEPQDAGHVPITEEFDSYKHTMPDAGPVIIALLLVAAVLGTLAYVFRATPVASGSIDEAFAVSVPNQNTVLSTIQITIKNVSKKPIKLRNINASLHTDKGEFNDDFASVADFGRYFQAFPELQQHSIEGLPRELSIPPGAQVSGSVIVSFPVTQQDFQNRRGMTISLQFYDQNPVVLKR